MNTSRALLTGALVGLLATACGAADGDPLASDTTNGETAQPASTEDVAADDSTTSQTDSPDNAEVPVVRIGTSTLSTVWLPLFVADEHGLFEEAGVDAEVTPFQGGGQAMAALSAGDIDILGGAAGRGITARAEGLPIIAALAQNDGFFYQLMAVSEDIESIEDLAGRRIAAKPGALSEQLLTFVLEQNGLADEVEIVGATNEQAEVALVEREAVDAVMTGEPTATIYVERGLATPLINFNSLDQLEELGWDYLIPTHSLTYLANENWLAENKDAASKALGAIQEALRMIEEDPNIAVETWFEVGELGTSGEDTVATSVETLTASFSTTGCLTEAGIDNLKAVVGPSMEVDTDIPFEELATNDYLPHNDC